MATITNYGATIKTLKNESQIAIIESNPTDGGRLITYGDFMRHVAFLRTSIDALNLESGSSIAILGYNSVEFLALSYAIMRAGHVAVPMSHRNSTPALATMCREASIKLAYVEDELDATLPSALPIRRFAPIQPWLDGTRGDVRPPVPRKASDIAMILFTSGSTGTPKAVPLTHAGYIWTIRRSLHGSRDTLKLNTRVLLSAPLVHMNALLFSQIGLAAGCTLVLDRKFTAERFLGTAARYRCDVITGVPPMMAMALAAETQSTPLDLECVTAVFLGSAPFDANLAQRIQQRLPNATIRNGWGTTECGPSTFGPHPLGKAKPFLSIGYPNKGVKVKLVGNKPSEGELYVKNPALTPGYLNRPTSTRAAFVDGWYRTKDIMRVDSDGFYYFVGRTDDMFTCGGNNVYPANVVQLLLEIPRIVNAAVIGVPDELRGAVPAAFVVCTKREHITLPEIAKAIKPRGPAYLQPRYLYVLDSLPLTRNNKVDLHQLRNIHEQNIVSQTQENP